jgi:dTDP-4-dehydrorhamnose 3,5-epimerase
MDIVPTSIRGCFEIRSPVHHDSRGSFTKPFQAELFSNAGLNTTWRESFWSSSRRGVLRGLHYQNPPSDHAKLVTCVKGTVWDVAVDLRRSSSMFGKHVSTELSAESGRALYIPRGMAHGFLALSDDVIICYYVETWHVPADDRGILWNSCGIPWPLTPSTPPIISARDAVFPSLSIDLSPFQ